VQKNHKKILKVSSIILGVVVALLILCGFWLYTGTLTSAKIAVFRTFPYPMATVNGHPILMSSFLFRYDVSKKMSGADVIAQKDDVVRSQIYTQLIDEAKLQQVADKHGVSVSQKEIDAEYNLRAGQSDLQGKKNYEELLASYGLNPGSYKSDIIEPELLHSNLQTWFSGQKDLNKSVYAQAEDLVSKIQSGQNMVILAVGNTQDETERGTGGDLGFVDPSGLLPELRDPVSSMKLGETKIIPSRYGLHIIRAEEQDGNKLHLREIFLKSGDFDKWYSDETKNFTVRQFVRL